MSEWKPEVVSITKVETHPNADNLDIAYLFENYPCIIKRGQYTVGALVGYIPVDTIVPDTESYAFLSAGSKDAEGNRKYAVGAVPERLRIIKARKIRSVYSMGLIVDAPEGFVEGQSIAEHLGLTKWEEEEEENIVSNPKAKGRTAKSPKGWQIPHYDLEGLRRLANALVNVESVYISEKLHGCWFGAVYRDGALWVKSRNLYKDEEGNCLWWQVANKYGLKEKLQKYPDLVLCGECYGQVSGFNYDAAGTSNLRLFDIFDTKRGVYLDYADFKAIIDDLGLLRVPELYVGPIDPFLIEIDGVRRMNFDALKPLMNGKSTLNPKHAREGFVIKPLKETVCHAGRLVLKMVGEDYSLAK